MELNTLEYVFEEKAAKDFNKANEIWEHFHDKAKVSFGIGTYLSNDTFADPLNDCSGAPGHCLSTGGLYKKLSV